MVIHNFEVFGRKFSRPHMQPGVIGQKKFKAIQGRKPRVESRGSKAEGRKPRVESRGSKAQGRKPRVQARAVEDWGRKAGNTEGLNTAPARARRYSLTPAWTITLYRS